MIADSYMGSALTYHMLKDVCDDEPAMISKFALENYGRFVPAGCSFQSMDHFTQMTLSGEFRKYKYESPEENV